MARQFLGNQEKTILPSVRSFTSFLNEKSRKRGVELSVLGELCQPKYNVPSTVYLAGGFPNPFTFPYESASFKMKNGEKLTIHGDQMTECLQYGGTQGYDPLLTKLRQWMTRHHDVRSWEASDLAVTNGSTEALSICLNLFLDSNTCFFAQDPLFGSAIHWIDTLQSQFCAVKSDCLGMEPNFLRKTAASNRREGVKMILLFNYSACDRTNTSEFSKRVAEIYDIAEEFNMFIVEIDQYSFLYRLNSLTQNHSSLLSLDTSGRVLRCDSLSTLFGSGLRVGWITGPRSLIERAVSMVDISTTHASNISQVLICNTLDTLEEEGLETLSREVRNRLMEERNDLVEETDIHLKGKGEWGIYPATPFLWFKVIDPVRCLDKVRREGPRFKVEPAYTDSSQPMTDGVVFGASFEGMSREHKTQKCQYIGELMDTSRQLVHHA